MGKMFYRKWLALLIFFSTTFLYAQSLIDTTGLTNPTIQAGHPRIFVTQDNFSIIVDRIKNHLSGMYQDLLDFAHENWNIDLDSLGNIAQNETGYEHRPAKKLLQSLVEAYGFIYLFIDSLPDFSYQHTKDEYGARGVDALMNLPQENDPAYVFQHHNHGCRPRYTGLAVGYDWLYNLLDPSQRAEIANRLIHNCIISIDSSKYDYNESCNIHNFPHFKENIGALAIYGDGILDNEAWTVIKHFYGWSVVHNNREYAVSMLSGGGLDVQHIQCGDGMTFDGFGYLAMQAGWLPFLEAWYTATGQDFFALSNYYQNLPLSIAYHYLPCDPSRGPFTITKMHLMSIGRREINVGRWSYPVIFAFLTNSLKRSNPAMACLSHWICEVVGSGFGVYQNDWAIRLATADPIVPPLSPAELNLPLVHKFDNHGVVMRTSWTDPEATFSTFTSLRFSVNRERVMSGSFTIWKNRGYLICHRGLRAHHDKDSRKPWYWNSLLLNDDDNGQRDPSWMSNAKEFLQHPDSLYHKVGGMKRFEWKKGKYVYICADISDEYSRLFPRLVELFTRQYVWFPSDSSSAPEHDYFIIFDRIITTDSQAKKEIILNTPYYPYIMASSWDTTQEMNYTEVRRGHHLFDNPHNIVVINNSSNSFHGQAHAKAFIKILLPDSCEVMRIGGPHDGYDQEDGITDFNHAPFDPDGNSGDPNCQYDPPLDQLYGGRAAFYGGMYRIEISPIERNNKDLFLTAIHATDISTSSASEIALLVDDTLIGALIGEKIAIFNKEDTLIDSGEISITQSGDFDILICDLYPNGKYEIAIGSNIDTVQSSEEGIIYSSGTFPNLIEINLLFIGIEDSPQLPIPLQSFICYPKIFNKKLHIKYTLNSKEKVSLKIYNLLGQVVKKIVEGKEEYGVIEHIWDGTDGYGKKLPSGAYFIRLKIGKSKWTRKVILSK